MKLYEIRDEYQLFEQLLNDATTDEELIFFQTKLIELGGQLEDKVEQLVYMIRNAESDVKALRDEEKRLADKRKSLENKIGRVKDSIMYSLTSTSTEFIKYPKFKVSIRTNQPSVNVLNVSKIPDEYLIPQEPKIDKNSIKADLKNGKEIEGVELIRTQSLQIK